MFETMNSTEWSHFTEIRELFRKEIERINRDLPELKSVLQQLVDVRSSSYIVETPVVYNTALDYINQDDEIKLILVGDNPGRREQEAGNRRYLVGPSGKIAEKFFRDRPELGIDFRKNVIILNKTPVHTPRTADLHEICRIGGVDLKGRITESQHFMARLLLLFQNSFTCGSKTIPVWITGYSEMREKGIFAPYTRKLKSLYQTEFCQNSGLEKSIFLYCHFSMNKFTSYLKKQTVPDEPLAATLNRIGTAYRQRFLW